MSFLKCLLHPRNIPRNINCILFASEKSYSTKKTINVTKTINKKSNKEEKPIKVNETFRKKIEDLGCEQEEEILNVTERERDATVRSRLSKACNTLTNKKILLTSSGLNLGLETGLPVYTNEDYCPEKNKNLKKDVSPPAKSKSDDPPSPPPSNRIVRGEPGKVLFAFIPIEWLEFFIPKTGVSGFYTFLFTFSTHLVSKEYYVLEHNYYSGLSVFIVVWAAIKYVGPHLRIYLDREIDKYESAWNKGRAAAKEVLEQQVEDEELLQYQADGQLILIEAKRENIALQLEDEFRKRQMCVYNEVKERLEYHVEVESVHQRIQHKNLVEYVHKEVLKSITPELQEQLINYSLDNMLSEWEKSNKNDENDNNECL